MVESDPFLLRRVERVSVSKRGWEFTAASSLGKEINTKQPDSGKMKR